MFTIICDDTWSVFNMQHTTQNLQILDYSDIFSGGMVRLKDLPTWLKVTTTLDHQPRPLTFRQMQSFFIGVRFWCKDLDWINSIHRKILQELWTQFMLCCCLLVFCCRLIFITRVSEVIMFSPCVFVCLWLCLCLYHDVCPDNLAMNDWCHTNNILQVHCWGCLVVQVMFPALMTSSMTSPGHKVGQIFKVIYLRQYLS